MAFRVVGLVLSTRDRRYIWSAEARSDARASTVVVVVNAFLDYRQARCLCCVLKAEVSDLGVL